VLDGASILNPSTSVAGDAIFISNLEQQIAPKVVGGDDVIIVKQYDAGVISGDIISAFAPLGTSFGGDDQIDASANASSIFAVGDIQTCPTTTSGPATTPWSAASPRSTSFPATPEASSAGSS